jgi:anaerobic ribonucleoside-triphosphate reductase activating protein
MKPYLNQVDGITFSGGEPLYQAMELLELLDKIPDIDKMLFTGYYKDELNDIQLKCFNEFDLVVEGRFEEDKMGDFLWRGSSNQIISSPSNKYLDQLDFFTNAKSAGLEVKIVENEIIYYGIPTKNNEIEKIEKFLENSSSFSKKEK